MTDSTALGDRMKRHEAAYRAVLPRRTYTVLRVDGRAFHAYLRGAERPFDQRFAADMDAVAEALCKEISGAVLAYTQSDEISVLCTDFSSPNAQPWFGGVVAKQISIAAAIATAELNARRPAQRALFDARLFTLADPVEVANYFLWRQRDAVRNSISMAAQARFSHRQLHGVSTGRMQEMLWSEHRINWSDYPDGFKRGRVTVRQVGERDVEYVDRRSGETVKTSAVRSWWETSVAPHFTVGGWLGDVIPALPRLGGALDGPAEQPAVPPQLSPASIAAPEPAQAPTFAAMAELAERARTEVLAERQRLEHAITTRIENAGLTIVRTDPVEQVAAHPASIHQLREEIEAERPWHGLWAAGITRHSPFGNDYLAPGRYADLPLVPDESLPPGEVHLRPHPRTADGPS